MNITPKRSWKEYHRPQLNLSEYYQDRLSSAPTCAWMVFGIIVLSAILILIALCLPANAEQEWTNTEIINAIYHAEGGEKAQFPYGIRSVSCESKSACRKVCENTIRNNRIRYAKTKPGQYPDFISFLGSRYCPTRGRTLTPSERRLNGNWKKNVLFFLNKARRSV